MKADKANHDMLARYANVTPIRPEGVIAFGGGSGNNGGMEQRVQILENNMVDVRDRLARIETRLDYTATKEDIARLEGRMETSFARLETTIARTTNKLILWSISTLVALAAATKWLT